MKLFQSEFVQSYKTYSFGYCNYAQRESGDVLAAIYNLGYLPYSGTKDISDVFYLCRSLRVRLAEWQMNSENRRVYKRFDPTLTSQTIPIGDFHQTESFLPFCLDYFNQRHGASIMPRERLELILQSVTHIREYKKDNTRVGYVFLVSDPNIDHYWYSFYDLAYANQSLGLWLMIDSVRQAKEAGKNYFYLGTAYGEKGLYKTNFDHVEYWTGSDWSSDITALKERCRSDEARTVQVLDEWKSSGHELF
jgi:leucyl-tRNA---protein transferase